MIDLEANGNDVVIYQGKFANLTGEYTVHVGYQLQDGTFLETQQPLRFTIR